MYLNIAIAYYQSQTSTKRHVHKSHSHVPVIKCSHHCLTGTSMSQVVDMFVFYKIQSILDSILLLSQS